MAIKLTKRSVTTQQLKAWEKKYRNLFHDLGLGSWRSGSYDSGSIGVGVGITTYMSGVRLRSGRWAMVTRHF